MPDENKIDPFKPQQPAIPGVLSSAQKSKLAAAAHQHWPPSPKVWVAFAVVVVLSAVGGYSYRHSGKSSAKANAPSSDTVKVAAVEAAAPPKTTENLPLAPGPVATTQELAKPWSTKRFLFRDPVTTQPEPAIVVRLPHGAYWGFSLREPFGNCELEYITDLQKLRTDYGFRADHPMVGDPCNHTVYDLLRYGSGAANDELVRGVIVQGTGIRPPMAIEIRTEGSKVLAVREE